MKYAEISKKYDIDKLTPEAAELFDIAQKFHFRKRQIVKWYLKPVYEILYRLTLFLAEIKSKKH